VVADYVVSPYFKMIDSPAREFLRELPESVQWIPRRAWRVLGLSSRSSTAEPCALAVGRPLSTSFSLAAACNVPAVQIPLLFKIVKMADRNQQHRPAGADGMHRVPAKSFSAKFQDKRELYTFLTSDCGIYCPPINDVTVWHLRDMVDGKKGKVLVDMMRHLTVPQYEELTIEKVVDWARKEYAAFANRYFPIDRELFKFPRQVSA